MSLIQGTGGGLGGAGAPGGALGSFYSHLLDQSLKFDDGDAQVLKRTPASASDRQKFTLSFWMKRGNLSSIQDPFSAGNSGTDRFEVMLTASDNLQVYMNNGGTIEQVTTTQVLRDVSAWYHIVLAFDTTDGTAANRLKVYVNGSQVTDFSTYDMSTVNFSTAVNSTSKHYISGRSYNDDRYFDGYLAEINLIDGTQLTPASFGETKDGIWTPKDTSGLTFGTNGFHLTFKDDVVSEGFNTVTYSGKGAVQSVNGLGFSPAMVWTKERDGTSYHEIHDIVRGPNKQLFPNENDAPESATKLSSFDGDGFTLAAHNSINESGKDYVGWCWEAGGTPTADNSAGAGATPTAGSVKIDGSNLGSALAGSIAATRLSANTARGFSVVGYPGNGSAGATVAHGLGATPKWIILKWLGGASNWRVHHTSVGTGHTLFLNRVDDKSTDADRISGVSSTTFTLSEGNAAINGSGSDYIAYCWAEISGYSKFGTYEGSGSDGNAVACGFEPAFLMIKNIDTDNNWIIFDNTRSPAPPQQQMIRANTEAIESTETNKEPSFTSTGFTIGDNDTVSNRDGDNYIFMAFADTREAAFFKDVTTNGNHWTPTNLDYRDSVPDVPTNNFATLNPLYSSISSSYPTPVLSEGNLAASTNSGSNWKTVPTTMYMSTGKWYAEVKVTYTDAVDSFIGFASSEFNGQAYAPSETTFGYQFHPSLGIRHNASQLSAQTFTQGDIIGLALNMDDNEIKFYKNGSLLYTATSVAAGSWSVALTLLYTKTLYANFGQDSSFAGKHVTANANADGNGHGSFAYAPPSGFLALCSQNLPDPAITDGTDNFNTVLYTGNNGNLDVTGVGFDPDWIWAKNRDSSSYHHDLYDSVRGDNLRLNSSQTADDATGFLTFETDGFSLTQGGGINANNHAHVAWNWLAGGKTPSQTYAVTVSGDSGANKYRFDGNTTDAPTLNLQEGGTYTFDQSDSSNSGHPLRFSTTSNGTHGGGSEYTTGVTTTGTPGNAGAKTVITVAASAATLYYYCTQHSGMGGQVNTNSTFGSTHLDGSILSTASVNTTAGFSIVSYTGNATAGATIGHGLSSTPEMLILKNRDSASLSWPVYHAKNTSAPETDYLYLNHTQATVDQIKFWNDTAPTPTVFSIGDSSTPNSNGAAYIAYCFHSVDGYSKVGSYTGNGSTNGTFIYTGFRPAWLMVKRTASGGWHMFDNKRAFAGNEIDVRIEAQESEEENTSGPPHMDFVSSGFKMRTTFDNMNASGDTYVYLAFAESPFKFANAR